MGVMQEIKEKWQKYLKEMAESNEKMWKGRKPGCCNKEEDREVKDGKY
ncbi:MAG: hypothetical protein KKH77_01520 [Candidatus Omnitrophica bacterium]|nr:hypothetical protein [Candidatus Omnitrophota bacterium]MBU1809513.1 hypothetical protein [Candidatus Omnitrophota bacterium]